MATSVIARRQFLRGSIIAGAGAALASATTPLALAHKRHDHRRHDRATQPSNTSLGCLLEGMRCLVEPSPRNGKPRSGWRANSVAPSRCSDATPSGIRLRPIALICGLQRGEGSRDCLGTPIRGTTRPSRGRSSRAVNRTPTSTRSANGWPGSDTSILRLPP